MRNVTLAAYWNKMFNKKITKTITNEKALQKHLRTKIIIKILKPKLKWKQSNKWYGFVQFCNLIQCASK